jgi:predicted component of type VI protein secretion system
MVSNDEFNRATQRGERRRRTDPAAVSARYDPRTKRIVIRLNSGIDLAFAPQNVQGLENAQADELKEIEISPTGSGLHFPRIDADVYIPSLLKGNLGSRKWMASRRRTAQAQA